MARLFLTLLALLVAVLAAFYQIVLSPLFVQWGWGRTIDSLNNANCERVLLLKACESELIHRSFSCLPSIQLNYRDRVAPAYGHTLPRMFLSK
jgi:hypothetical protein